MAEAAQLVMATGHKKEREKEQDNRQKKNPVDGDTENYKGYVGEGQS